MKDLQTAKSIEEEPEVPGYPDSVDNPAGIKPVYPRDRPKDTFDEPDDLGVDVV